MTSGGSPYPDLLGGPPPTLLPPDPGAAALEAGAQAEAVAAQYPGSCAAWAALADQAWHAGEVVQSYAFARTGYHRGLDALRRNGWKGHGPVPWSHEPNRGWLRALHALGRLQVGREARQVPRIHPPVRRRLVVVMVVAARAVALVLVVHLPVTVR